MAFHYHMSLCWLELLIQTFHCQTWMFFAGVAFKKQREVQPKYHNLVAQIGTHFMDVVCTSGVKTGSAADIDKIRKFRSGCGDKVLALASGVTPQNVLNYVPYVDCILVATGEFKKQYSGYLSVV